MSLALFCVLLAAGGCAKPAELTEQQRRAAIDAWLVRAKEYAGKAAAANPKLAPSRYGIVALQCAWLGRFDEALETLRREPEGPSPYVELATALATNKGRSGDI
jgi:hypothetical protein